MKIFEFLKDPSYLPSFIIAFIVVGFFVFKTIRIFFREGIIQHIKDDWTYRLPYRIQHNRYRGASRPAYAVICCLYYLIKTLFLLILAFDIYFIKFLVWDIWKWLSREDEYEDCADEENLVEESFTPPISKSANKSIKDETSSSAMEHSSKISTLWNNGTEEMWLAALKSYWDRFNDDQYRLEKAIDSIEASDVAALSVYEFYDFLYQQYYPWKFTNKLFLSRNRKHLEKYLLDNEIERLAKIQKRLFNLDLADIKECLAVASSINGLGTAGASGLLSILYPEYFGTVDRFVVYSLLKIKDLQEKDAVSNMNPESLTLNNGVLLIEIMRNKAQELNKRFKTDFWTPRKIDMILWTIR